MESFEKKVMENRTRFDLLALLRLLKEHNYNPIWFESNDSSASEVSLIDKITFETTRVVITLNVGLLSPQTELPSYFFQFRDKHLEAEGNFNTFLRYFDHFLILNYIQNRYPLINRTYFTDWEEYKRTFFVLSNGTTQKTVHFIFASVYPECTVFSENAAGRSCVEKDKTPLGKIRLGTPYQLGDLYPEYSPGISITLLPGDRHISLQDIFVRFNEIILPLVSGSDLYLEVRMSGSMAPFEIGSAQSLGFRKLLNKDKKDEIILFGGKTNCKR